MKACPTLFDVGKLKLVIEDWPFAMVTEANHPSRKID